MNTNKELLTTIREALHHAKLLAVVNQWPMIEGQMTEAKAALDQLEAQQADIGKLIEAGDATFVEDLEEFFNQHIPCECESEHGITCSWCRDTSKLLERAAKSAAPAQQQPKRLTDAEIKRIADAAIPPFTGMNSSHSFRVEHHHEGALKALLYARDNGYIGGLSVEEVMSEVHEALVAKGIKFSDETLPVEQDLHARLTAKAQGK